MTHIHILAVDDEEFLLDIYRRVLDGNGYMVDTALTAEEALQKMKSNTYKLCLLDVTLPDMRGTELLKLMRNIDPAMKILIVTGDWSPSDVASARKNGADEFVLKPLERDALIETVERVLNQG